MNRILNLEFARLFASSPSVTRAIVRSDLARSRWSIEVPVFKFFFTFLRCFENPKNQTFYVEMLHTFLVYWVQGRLQGEVDATCIQFGSGEKSTLKGEISLRYMGLSHTYFISPSFLALEHGSHLHVPKSLMFVHHCMQ